ncbi:accessory gene regulator B family protein [Paenibacillus illinoisensis]|uniref:accessory gene regulator B family protein n=1 Tax=Paenibacillus illinoisensis TaxID=59845 RepID=UPI00301D1152
MIEAAAWRIATHIKSVVPQHPASVEVLNHSLIIVINFFTVVGLSLIGSIFTGQTKEVILLLQCFAILRQLTGGLHLESSTWCAVATAATATILSLVPSNYEMTLILTSFALLIVLNYAPAGIDQQTIIPERFYPILKVVGVILISSNFWIASHWAAIAYFVQGIMLMAYVNLKGGDLVEG